MNTAPRVEWEVIQVTFVLWRLLLGERPQEHVLRTFRWRWLAKCYAYLHSWRGPNYIVICSVGRHRPTLRVITGGKAA